MSPEESIRSVLAAAAGVTAIVGDRIYPDEVPQGDPLPAVVYRRAATPFQLTLDDTVARSGGTMRVACWAGGRLVAEQLGDAVQLALIAAQIYPVGRDGFTDPDTGEEAALLDVEVD
jgi:hypothetical protein